MKDIEIELKATGSNGEQTLHLTEDRGEYWFTLCGQYKGNPIQIDFDNLDKADLLDIKAAVELILEEL